MKCEECYYRKRGKCELNTEAEVEQVRMENMKLLEDICKASTPRFVDEENLRDQFKARLDMFYDVGAVLYTLPMQEYLPGDNEEDREKFANYEFLKRLTYDRCSRQAETRILTLGRASCGFVGEYSSGKSSCLNAEAFGDNLLPTSAGKTTSIPTYVFWGRKNLLIYENM